MPKNSVNSYAKAWGIQKQLQRVVWKKHVNLSAESSKHSEGAPPKSSCFFDSNGQEGILD